MAEGIVPGLTAELSTIVGREQTAQHLGSGKVEVFGTPALVGLMEMAAIAAVEGHLPDGQGTVGAQIDVKHLAPTPVGMRVTAKASLEQVEGRKLLFRVEAHDEREKVGEAVHLRIIVDLKRFQERAKAKSAAPPEGERVSSS